MARPKLTIGTTHFDDFTGLWATIQSLRMYHASVMPVCELVVIDNNPKSAHGTKAKELINSWVKGDLIDARWIGEGEVVGTAAAKNRVFQEARGDAVLYMDCHVLIASQAVSKLLLYYEANPETKDLLSGPLVYDNLTGMSTHFSDVWRGEMWGIWDMDKRGADSDGAPFEIPAMGGGVFSCKREAWLGFNEHFRGFGGEEFYIHEKFRAVGAKCLCLPFLRWVHRFGRPDGVKYPLYRKDKVRNYMIGHRELGKSLDRAKAHFVDDCKMPEKEWGDILSQVDEIIKPTKRKSGCGGCGGGNKTKTLQEWFEVASNTASDINEHCEKLRDLASQCEHVTEFGMRHGVSTVALLAGQPGHLVTYDVRRDPILSELTKQRGETVFAFHAKDVLIADIATTDMLFIDTKHTESQLTAELTRHASKVRRWIVLHDTAIYGERGEDGGPGLLPALRRFMQENLKWSVVYHTQANNGLTVISSNIADKMTMPSTGQIAKTFMAAVATHVADGAKAVSRSTLESRLEICTICTQRVIDRCAACGCYVAKKAAWNSEGCPLGHWRNEMEVAQV